MSIMFEVYYGLPVDLRKETTLSEHVAKLGGRLTYREDPAKNDSPICLTYEFDDRDRAEAAAGALRAQGEHVEGPMDYGPDGSQSD